MFFLNCTVVSMKMCCRCSENVRSFLLKASVRLTFAQGLVARFCPEAGLGHIPGRDVRAYWKTWD